MSDSIRIEIRPGMTEADPLAQQDGWLARINGTEVPVAVFAVEQDETGQPVLLLQLRPDSLTIGRRPASESPEVATESQQISSWGSAGQDPREGIPGWQPESLGEQVARNAEVSG